MDWRRDGSDHHTRGRVAKGRQVAVDDDDARPHHASGFFVPGPGATEGDYDYVYSLYARTVEELGVGADAVVPVVAALVLLVVGVLIGSPPIVSSDSIAAISGC